MASAYAYSMPSTACEHLNTAHIKKIKLARKSASSEGLDIIQYRCSECPISGGFPALDKHFKKTQHQFAVSAQSIYCGQCNDLIYDPAVIGLPPTAKKRRLSYHDEEEEAFMSANTTPRPCGREGVRGLFNLGETCYMNAVLQMMVHNPLLASYFLGMGHPVHLCPLSKEQDKKNNESDSEEDDSSVDKPEQKTCVACGMTDVFSDITMADTAGPAHAVNLLFASWKNVPTMSGKQQQDAQEWFIMIVDKLHEAITSEASNRHRCECFFHKVFFGRHDSEITCEKCKATSTTEEEYSSISLDFKKQAKKKKKQLPDDAKSKVVLPNVAECLKAYTAPEALASDQYTCRNCDAPRSANKSIRISRLPAILCIHVKRFGMMKISNGTLMGEKYDGKIEFPMVLDMGPYTTQTTQEAQEGRYMYDLECVVVHQGDNAHSGHYFAFCREGGKWFRFDDEIVSATTLEDVMRQEAYLLFYSLRLVGRSKEK